MSSKKSSPIQRLAEISQNVEVAVACFMALVVVPIVGLVLLFCAEGKLRVIGLGALVYSFALFVVLPGLALAANAKRGSNKRLFASIVCFVLGFFAFFYLSYTVGDRQDIKYISVVPISLVGIIFFAWWTRDCIFFDDSSED